MSPHSRSQTPRHDVTRLHNLTCAGTVLVLWKCSCVLWLRSPGNVVEEMEVFDRRDDDNMTTTRFFILSPAVARALVN